MDRNNASDEFTTVILDAGGVFRGHVQRTSGSDYVTLKLADGKSSMVRIRFDAIAAVARMTELERNIQQHVMKAAQSWKVD